MSAATELELAGRRVLVVGLGRSGRAVARLCLARGASVTLTDKRPCDAFDGQLGELASRCRLALGGHRVEDFVTAELIVLSPGVPPLAALDAARSSGVPIAGEVEIASRFVEAPIIGVTGTNGKSTTTQLIGDMLACSACEVFCGGNLGQPLSEVVEAGTLRCDAVVLELSSFQLETVDRFHAHVAVLLNLSEDHLDRYSSFADYVCAKARLFERQTGRDHAVVSGEPSEQTCRALAESSPAKRWLFAERAAAATQGGGWLDSGRLWLRVQPEDDLERYERASLRLPGRHNTLNALAALLAARLAGATPAGCASALSRFVGLPHRMQLVRELGGVRYYNDSKATNVGAVVGSLDGFERPYVLIAGGKDKGGRYDALREVAARGARHVVLIGAAAHRIARALAECVPHSRAGSMEEAVTVARRQARVGDAVVLSPACSSFDMYDSYEHRGRVFSEAVRRLSGETRG